MTDKFPGQCFVISRALLLAMALVFVLATNANCEESGVVRSPDEALNRMVGDYSLIDQTGRPFKLKDLKGAPYVINFVYTKCKHTCSTITGALANAYGEPSMGLGKRFRAITVGFDTPNDTPSAMRAYSRNFVKGKEGWLFASGDEDTIRRLVFDLGFSYVKVEGGFDHPNMATVVSAEGRVFRHFYGLDFPVSDLSNALSVAKNPGAMAPVAPKTILDKLKFFCYTYDPATGTYKLDYAVLMGLVVGVVIYLMIMAMLGYIYFIKRHLKKREQAVRENNP